jgi:hypothetical protein
MKGRMERRRFLLLAAGAAGTAFLAAVGLAGRAASALVIPFKRFDRRKLGDPHDLAG